MVGDWDDFGRGDRFGGNTLLSGAVPSVGPRPYISFDPGPSPYERERIDAARPRITVNSPPPPAANPLAGLDIAALTNNFPSVDALAANLGVGPVAAAAANLGLGFAQTQTQGATSGAGMFPGVGAGMPSALGAQGDPSQATFFGTPIFPPNGGFAPPDFYSENTLRIFAEAGRKLRAMDAARNSPITPSPAAVPGASVPATQGAPAAPSPAGQQAAAFVVAIAQLFEAQKAAAKKPTLPPLPVLKTPEEVRTEAATETQNRALTETGSVKQGKSSKIEEKNSEAAAIGELHRALDRMVPPEPALDPDGRPRSWKLPGPNLGNHERARTIERIMRNINFAFEKATGGVGRILRQAGRGVGEAFEGKIGIGPETWRALVKAGIFRSSNTDLMSGVQAFNEILIGGGAIAGDLALRTLQAVENFGVEAIVQFAREAGESETGARKLQRDLHGLAMIAGIAMGSNAGAFGRGARGRVSAKRRDSRARRQLAEGLNVTPDKLPIIGSKELFGEFRRRFIKEIQELKSTGRMSQTEVRRWEELRARLDVLDGAFAEAKGEIVEEVLFRLLQRAGVKARKPKPGGKGDIEVFDSKGKRIAKFDQVIEGEIETITSFFVVRTNTKGAALIDAKAGRTGPTTAQSRAVTAFEEGKGLTVRLRDSHGNLREIPVKTIDWFRLPLDRAPLETLTRVYRRTLQRKKHRRKPVFSDAELDEILDSVRAWHRQAVAQRRAGKAVGGALTLGGLALILGFLTETKVQADIRRQRTVRPPVK